MTDEEAAAVLARLPTLVNGNAALVRRGRFLTTDFLVCAGAVPVILEVREGRLGKASIGSGLMRSWRFAVRAGAEAWAQFWQPLPPPGYNDILGMTRFGAASIEGDLQPLMANLRYVKEVLEAPRRAARERADGR